MRRPQRSLKEDVLQGPVAHREPTKKAQIKEWRSVAAKSTKRRLNIVTVSKEVSYRNLDRESPFDNRFHGSSMADLRGSHASSRNIHVPARSGIRTCTAVASVVLGCKFIPKFVATHSRCVNRPYTTSDNGFRSLWHRLFQFKFITEQSQMFHNNCRIMKTELK